MVKSFLKTGSVHGSTRRFQIRQAALKMFFVGQHRQRRRAALFIKTRDAGRIEFRRQHAFARRCLLDFGDDGGLVGPMSAARKSRRCAMERSARSSTRAHGLPDRASSARQLWPGCQGAPSPWAGNFNCSATARARPDATATRSSLLLSRRLSRSALAVLWTPFFVPFATPLASVLCGA